MQLLGFVLLRETYAPAIQKQFQQRAGLFAEPGAGKAKEKLTSEVAKKLTTAIKLLYCEPTIQLVSLYGAFLYGLMYIAISSMSELWQYHYGESLSISGLNYISLGLGFVLGSQFGAFANRWVSDYAL